MGEFLYGLHQGGVLESALLVAVVWLLLVVIRGFRGLFEQLHAIQSHFERANRISEANLKTLDCGHKAVGPYETHQGQKVCSECFHRMYHPEP